MNYSDGWQKAIDKVNARIKNGVTSEMKSEAPQPPEREEPEAPEPQQRDAIIFNVCRSFGMPELAPSFIGDSRALTEIMRGIYASKIQTEISKMAGRSLGNWVR